MITVRIEEEDLLDMLMNRLKTWTNDEETIELFENFYENRVYSGCFEGSEINIMSIVDNDYINNTSIVGREEYNRNRNEFLRNEIQHYIQENKNLYDDEEKADYIESLKGFIQNLVEETPNFDDVECGENNLDFLSGYYIEAKTDILLLMS